MNYDHNWDVITDEQLEDINELENAELDAELEHAFEDYSDESDDEPSTGYAFNRVTVGTTTDGLDDEITQNSKIVTSDYLPDILRAFEDFLRDAGFTYVRSLGAECGEDGNVTWSSAD